MTGGRSLANRATGRCSHEPLKGSLGVRQAASSNRSSSSLCLALLLGGFCETCHSGKGTDSVQQEVHDRGHPIGDMPILDPVDAQLKGQQRDDQQDERDQDCSRCWHCVASTQVADGGIIQDCIQQQILRSSPVAVREAPRCTG